MERAASPLRKLWLTTSEEDPDPTVKVTLVGRTDELFSAVRATN
jgi:hypothetical protein